MGFLRKRLTPQDAFEKVLEAISSWPPPPSVLSPGVAAVGGNDGIRYEQAYLALFAALFALKFSRSSDWRLNGQDLFAALNARVIQNQLSARGSAMTVLEQQIAGDRVGIYGLALEVVASNPSAANTAREMGRTFAILLGAEDNAALRGLGEQTFSQAFDRLVEVTMSFKL